MGNYSAKEIALGGILAAVAIVIICMGGLIPVATYACPVLCTLLCSVVMKLCGRRVGWAWYAAVSLLALLLGPDKEAAGVFLLLGYYPLLKGWFDKFRLSILLKLIYFNASILLLYGILIYLLGLEYIAKEFSGVGIAGLILMILLGNVTFFLLDHLLNRLKKARRRQ